VHGGGGGGGCGIAWKEREHLVAVAAAEQQETVPQIPTSRSNSILFLRPGALPSAHVSRRAQPPTPYI